MKLVQCNVWWGGKLDKNLLHFLEAEKPDILCLQEAVKFTDKDAGPFLTIQQMQNHGGLDYHAFAPSFSFNLMNGIASFGNAILSRYPIKSESSLYTHLEPVENFDFNEHDYNVRNFIHTVLDVEGRDCNVLTHHGYHIPDHKDGNEETLQQMNMLAEYIQKLEGPIVLTGDFNLAPHSKSIEVLNQELRNLSVEAGLKTTRSALTYKTEVCDYIFVNDAVNVKSFEASDELVSDHKALILDFEI